ncbi:hypothetical protein OO014_15650 [Intrasporangium calvum]|uniref:Peptidase C39-like domain-containing protein n=1 Tax=Intrasporangium calvum TaxID=53358 RepID=A0ABT5GKE1_9MICO|nr:hypothetical protein [Intrasporangium calvum]MDC5698690.1 hypothetical protein [Intrasporangium calvum]
MIAPFHLQAGDRVPVQQSSTTCGSASLTVARMLVNPAFARWIRFGLDVEAKDEDARDARTVEQRFAAHEQVVASRTNSLVGAGGRIQVPWPRALGTPPWGARGELEFGAAVPWADYDITLFRFGGRGALEQAYADLQRRVRAGRPALLYIGNAWLPRHVVLVMPATRGQELDVYEPSVGRVVDLPRQTFVERRLRMAGWDVPWGAVWDDAPD